MSWSPPPSQPPYPPPSLPPGPGGPPRRGGVVLPWVLGGCALMLALATGFVVAIVLLT